MAKVRRVPSTTRTISKQSSGGSVRSTRQPSTIREMGDTDFPTLNSGADGLFITFDADSEKFKLVDADTILQKAASDGDLPDTFITQVEQEINLGDIAFDDLDGGSF